MKQTNYSKPVGSDKAAKRTFAVTSGQINIGKPFHNRALLKKEGHLMRSATDELGEENTDRREAWCNWLKYRYQTVSHESGHIIGYMLLGGKIELVSTNSEWIRSQGLGYNAGIVYGHFISEVDSHNIDYVVSPLAARRRLKKRLENEIMVSLAGRIGTQLAPLTVAPGITRDRTGIEGDKDNYVSCGKWLAEILLYEALPRASRAALKQQNAFAVGSPEREARDRMVPSILLGLYRRIKRLMQQPQNLYVLQRLAHELADNAEEFIAGKEIHALVRSARRDYTQGWR